MKKAIALSLALMLCLGMFACGTTPQPESAPTTPAPTAETTPSISSIIKNAVLQYPASNDLFKYNIYDTYVEISEYIGDDNAAEVIVPATLENLPVYVVDSNVFDKSGVKSIIFEDGIFTIHSRFSPTLESVTLPATLDFVGYGTFENCYKLKTVIIPEGIDSIQPKAFMHCGSLTEITIPSTVRSLSNNIFAFCDELETVNLPEGLTEIEHNAFLGCKSLKTLTIPSTVKKLGHSVFQGTGLVSIEIPETVEEMGSGAFTACKDLTTIKVYNANLKILPESGYLVALLFSQHNPDLVVYGKAASTIAKACASEDVFFQVIQ